VRIKEITMNTQWPGAGNFESLARQYWNAWGDAMRTGASATGQAGGMPGWQEAIDWWSRQAQGSNAGADATVDRFNAQARDWYGQMQRIAAQFAGQNANPADIVAEWKRALGGLGENPFNDMFHAMRGQGAQGVEQWMDAAKPWLDALRREGSTWLGMPTFGLGREQQERWQQLAQAQLDYQQHDNAYNALMLQASQRAYDVFEKKLAEHSKPGQQLTTARGLFDLWIDSAEEAYATIALSPEFRAAYGARVNAQMRLRQAVQREMEQMSTVFGMPTRSDLDAAFRKISELERALRRMRDDIPAPVRPEAPAAATASSGSARKSTGSADKAKPAGKPKPAQAAGKASKQGKSR
jgi:poly[(R)-3-hydroxyalkanoate] polymerase subunit PhaE